MEKLRSSEVNASQVKITALKRGLNNWPWKSNIYEAAKCTKLKSTKNDGEIDCFAQVYSPESGRNY